MNRKEMTTTISTTAINALVQCAESIVIPPRSNALIKCKAPKIRSHVESIMRKFVSLNLLTDTRQTSQNVKPMKAQ